MTDLHYSQGSGRPLAHLWPPEALAGVAAWAERQEACDNPYSAWREPERYAAWRDGFQAAEAAWADAYVADAEDAEDAEACEAIGAFYDLMIAAGVPEARIEGLLS